MKDHHGWRQTPWWRLPPWWQACGGKRRWHTPVLVANAVVAVLPAVVADAYGGRADVKRYLLYLNNNKDNK